MDTKIRTEQHIGWWGENILVQDARRPFNRRVASLLQVDGLAATGVLPSERRIAAGIDTRMYYTYPLLFYTSFPNVSLAQLRALSICGSYLFDYVLSVDEVLDRPSPRNSGSVVLGGALYREALCGLCELLPPPSVFWSRFDRYFEQFCQAVLHEESRHRDLVRPYTQGELEMIYSGKAAVAKACLAALAALDGDDLPLGALESSHDSFYIAFQLADDLDDWRIDYERGHYSYPLTRAFLPVGWHRRVESAERPAVVEVGDLLVRHGVVEEIRGLALSYLDRAAEAVAGLTEGSWHAAIRTTRDRIIQSDFNVGAPDQDPVAPSSHRDRSAKADEPWGDMTAAAAPVAPVAPVAPSWRAWLDPERPPRVVQKAILEEQQRALRTAGSARTTGEALCQVGVAIVASLRAFPQWGVAEHLGISRGELDWFDSHGAWLDGLLALGLDERPELWTPDSPVAQGAIPGWVPPTVGRYLGHRLVAEYMRELAPGAAPTADAVLSHYRARSVA